MNEISYLEMIRESTAEWLAGREDFRGVQVMTRKRGDVVAAALEQVAKLGACLVLYIPSAIPKSYQSESVTLDPIHLVVECIEHTTINQGPTGTKKGAMYLAERVAASLQMWTPPLPSDAGCSPFMPESPGIQEMPIIKDQPALYVVQARFATRCTIPHR